jgi:transcriptional regulator with XRE-family HTH domain
MSCGSPAYHSLVEALRARREELGLSQIDVDEKIGVTRGQTGKWELGERKPRAFLLGCWADALDVELTIR